MKNSILKELRKYSVLRSIKKNLCIAASLISPRFNTRICYYLAYGRRLDLKNPVTLDEKILWLKLNRYIKDPLVIQCADKYRVREYVKECGCESILIELISVYKSADEIVWEELPQKFVLKWNFGATLNVLCQDKSKLNGNEVKRQLAVWGKTRPWLAYSEFQYKYAPKRIVCERLIENYDSQGSWIAPEDYKVYCFNGVPTYIMVCMDRGLYSKPKFYFFDAQWKLARINRDSINAPGDFTVEKPKCLDELLRSAAILSKPFPFVRADFYISGDKVYFGELTFTPGGGVDYARLPETNLMMGQMLELPK